MHGRFTVAVALALMVVCAAGCTPAAESHDTWFAGPAEPGAAPTAAEAATGRPGGTGPDPCELVTEADVETALSVTIATSRPQPADPRLRALSFGLPERVCEYHGLVEDTPAAGRRAGASEPAPDADPARREPGAVASTDAAVAAELRALDRPASGELPRLPPEVAEQLETLELVVGVSAQPLTREEFDVRFARRAAAVDQVPGAESEPVDPAAPPVSDFVDRATGGATGVMSVGDAARWYPAAAQLDVLVDDVAFSVSVPELAPMVSQAVSGVQLRPLADPPPAVVDVARQIVRRLEQRPDGLVQPGPLPEDGQHDGALR